MYVNLYDVHQLIPWTKKPAKPGKFYSVDWVKLYGEHLSKEKYHGHPWKVCKQTSNSNRGQACVFPEIAALYLEWLNGTNSYTLSARVKEVIYPFQSFYLIQCQEFQKVGISQNFQNRLMSIQTNTPFDVNVIKVVEVINALEYERQLHEILDGQCVKGEWFKLTFSQIQEAIQFMEKARRESVEFIHKSSTADDSVTSQLSLFA